MLCKSGSVFARGILGPDKICSPRCQRNAKVIRDDRNARVADPSKERSALSFVNLGNIANLLVVWRPFFSHLWHAALELLLDSAIRLS